ncbi:MAG: DUF4198 domain-containing protein [Cellvibrionaceae bacterium]
MNNISYAQQENKSIIGANFFGSLMAVAIFFAVIAVPLNAWSHSRWIVPSHSILSGKNSEYVSLDISISNDIFHPDNSAGGVSYKSVGQSPKGAGASQVVTVFSPDGTVDKSNPIVSVMRKSVSAVLLDQSGTYKISFEQAPLVLTLFKNKDGSPGRIFGPLKNTKSRLPDGANEIHEMELNNEISTYITRNDVTTDQLKPAGKGLELVFKTHPNEMFVGEQSELSLLFDGKPVTAGTNVLLTRQGTRYRNDRESIDAKTDEAGNFSVDWKKSGLYLLECEIEMDDANHKPTQNESQRKIVHAVYVTLEVNAE